MASRSVLGGRPRFGGVRIDALAWLCALALLVAGALVDADSARAAESDAALAATSATEPTTFRVYAHREGLVGYTTANGHVIQENDRFVALPCFCVLSSKGGKEFQVKIEYKGRSVVAPVWDVGPWNINDNYWDPAEKRTWQGIPQGVPQAAAAFYNGYNGGLDGKGRKVRSPAGIDIADGTFWHDLGMVGSDWVTVTFLWLPPPAKDLPPLPEGYGDIPTIYAWQRPPLDPVEPKKTGGYTYFPETRHNVAAPLVEWWHQNGGWRNLGLPISELVRVVNADGSTRIVQYFERAILELNLPRSEGLPLVTSALVGYGAYAPPEARARVAPFESNEHHWYLAPTGHSLSNGFKAHWHAYGGLSAFGYPITEEFSAVAPDGRKYVAQVFERARFEWWPDRVGKPDEITHGLLVVESLRQAGWVP